MQNESGTYDRSDGAPSQQFNKIIPTQSARVFVSGGGWCVIYEFPFPLGSQDVATAVLSLRIASQEWKRVRRRLNAHFRISTIVRRETRRRQGQRPGHRLFVMLAFARRFLTSLFE